LAQRSSSACCCKLADRSISGIPNSRYWPDRDLAPFIRDAIQDTQRESEVLAEAGKPVDPLPPANLLAISGGGDAGASAAGILAGWSAHGDRPEFKVVTGVSAGALIAPFAFLGAQYDDVVRNVATSIGPRDVFHAHNRLVGLASDGSDSSRSTSRRKSWQRSLENTARGASCRSERPTLMPGAQ
jgi:hypothetical protein